MKHKLKITLMLLAIFLISQLIGLAVTASYQKHFLQKPEVKPPQQQQLPPAAQPQPQPMANVSIASQLIPEKVEFKSRFDVLQILISFVVGLVIATIVFIILMRIGVVRFMRFWLFFVVVIGLFLSLSLLLFEGFGFNIAIGRVSFSLAEILAAVFAIVLAYFKVYRGDVIVHNVTELLVYPGIVVLFLPLLNVVIAIVLLLLLSVYDFVAVFKTRHMQKMARFMIKDVRAFSGVMLPYLSEKEKKRLMELRARMKAAKGRLKAAKIKVNLAVLGGGDIAFPMLFSSIVFLTYTAYHSLLIILFSTLALALLLLFGKKGEAYPALPPLAVGSLIGFLVSLLVF
jgi:presenilin-like A22 family membrane protease